MKKLKVDLDELAMAFTDFGGELEYYLDTETGQIMFDAKDFGIEMEEIDFEQGDRYIWIGNPYPHEGYGDMEDFIFRTEDQHLADLLSVAIRGKGAFRRFKGVLLDHLEARDAWHAFSNQRWRDRAVAWLGENGIEAE